jgi:hypothetical protein
MHVNDKLVRLACFQLDKSDRGTGSPRLRLCGFQGFNVIWGFLMTAVLVQMLE